MPSSATFAGDFSVSDRTHEPCRTGADYLSYLEELSAYAVARTIGVTQQTVTRCLERAAELGVIAALDDRPRAGRDPVITTEAKTWLVALACQKPKELGYPHELWTTRLLAAHPASTHRRPGIPA